MATAWTVLLVVFGWVLFRAESFGGAVEIYRAMGGAAGELASPLALHVDAREAFIMALGVLLAAPIVPAIVRRTATFGNRPAMQLSSAAWTLALLALTIVGLAGQTHSPFLYFRF